ncbi:MAG: sulfite exporter TauE/SafE family protein [Vicingaceae bacterium]
MEIYPALLLGLFGSLHCIGMCGPIALALPLKNHSVLSKILSALLYNIGRVTTYFLIGLLFGLLSKTIAIAGFQQYFSVIIGVLLIVGVIFPAIARKSKSKIFHFINKPINLLKNKMGKLFQSKRYDTIFLIGLLNGFLPCGLVYVAIAGALVEGEIFKGGAFMFFFGLGTIPGLFLLSMLKTSINLSFRIKIQKVVPVLIVCFGILFILRGMNLGIPYISPKIANDHSKVESCCHKP